MDGDGPWIVVPGWGRFQHYRDRDPTWIKVYCELAHKPEWHELSYRDRGLLVTIWIEFASTNGQLTANMLPRSGQLRVRLGQLERLNHTGFIELSASRPLALRARQGRELSKESSKEGASSGAIASAAAASPQEGRDSPVVAPADNGQVPDAVQRGRPPDDLGERDPEAIARIRELMETVGWRTP